MHHRVLVVDDYPDAAEIACTLLTMLGHECRSASTGREALEAARALEPDIALLDIGLPDISGYEVANELRRAFQGKPLYLAAVTGWAQPADRARAIAAGFDLHVIKPADGCTLRDIVRLAEARQLIAEDSEATRT